MDVSIPDERGVVLNSRVEISGGDIILHSRSGGGATARNPEYRLALEVILRRLAREGIKPEVFLDSGPVQGSPLADRLLASPAELTGDVAQQFDLLVRRSNAGSSSHGAYRRLRLRVPAMPEYALKEILDGSARRRTNGLPAAQLERVTRAHLDAAIAEMRSGRERPTRFDQPTGYLLLPPDGGAPLPPKKVFGIALAEALQTYTTPQDFTSGARIFEIMRDRGLVVRALEDEERLSASSEAADPDGEAAGDQIPATPEERAWIEGAPYMASHLRKERSGSLPGQFKTQFRLEHGKLYCQRCERDYVADYGAFAEACFEVHHTVLVSKMKPGHMTTAGELRLLCANCHRAVHREMASAG